jgi:hypothetical protein
MTLAAGRMYAIATSAEDGWLAGWLYAIATSAEDGWVALSMSHSMSHWQVPLYRRRHGSRRSCSSRCRCRHTMEPVRSHGKGTVCTTAGTKVYDPSLSPKGKQNSTFSKRQAKREESSVPMTSRPVSTAALKLWPTKEGELEKKSPSAMISWQKRYWILGRALAHPIRGTDRRSRSDPRARSRTRLRMVRHG